MHPKSSIRDNRKRGTVGSFLKSQINAGSALSFVSAYFTIYAFNELRQELESIERLRFLFGEPSFLKKLDPEKSTQKAYETTEGGLFLANRLQQSAIARACAEWIEAHVEIKSMVRPNFLHGKLYHILNQNGRQEAIVGSSNFTLSGLGLAKKANVELNMAITDDRDRDDLLAWFDEAWDEKGDFAGIVEDVKAQVLEYLEQLYVNSSPELIYYKTLFHVFENFINDQDSGGINGRTGFFDTQIWATLYGFQKDAVKGIIRKIQRHNGCILADSVGLGKTFEALAVVKYFELTNQSVLVLCPKKLRENWTVYLGANNSELNPLVKDRFNYTVLSHTDLSREGGKTGDIDLSTITWGNFGLVVIDESHNFRNNLKGKLGDDGQVIRRSRYERLMQDIIQSGVQTRVLLLSATPVNNTLSDLRNQIYFITGANDHAMMDLAQIPSIKNALATAQKTFTNWADPKKNKARDVRDLLERLDPAFFKLLDELTIARSRKHIKTFYKAEMAEIGAFPTRLPVRSVAPVLDLKGRFPSYDRLNEEILKYKLSLYSPFKYVLPAYKSYYEALGKQVKNFSQENRETYLIGMMKVNFLKRLESSIEAFEITLDRTIIKIDDLRKRIEHFQKSEESSKIDDFEVLDLPEDEEDEDLTAANEAFQSSGFEVGKKFKYDMAHLDLEKWHTDLKEDAGQLGSLFNNANSIDPNRDGKLAELKKILAEKFQSPINDGNRKAIVFTAFADTAYYLYDNLSAWAEKEFGLFTAVIAGGTRQNLTTFKPKGFRDQTDFNQILINFSPVSKKRELMKTMPQKGSIDLLIATDCISEGQNLQDADTLINYDIHWNPVRIIQRFGRIDRLGSVNDQIQMVNFWPTPDLNKYINLKERVEARMALVDITATGEENLLDTEQIVDLIEDDLKFRNQQLKRLKTEVLDLEDLQESVDLTDFSLDDFRIDLLNYLEGHREKLRQLPLGLFAVVPAPAGKHGHFSKVKREVSTIAEELIRPGIIFCLRQKGEIEAAERVNPLHPYFLIYIREDGTVRLQYVQAKQILEVFRLLCQGVTEAYEELCDLFSVETDGGENMETQNKLLQKAIENIRAVLQKRNAAQLGNDRGAILFEDENEDGESKIDDMELVTWLVIK